jgi:hypothetical protein
MVKAKTDKPPLPMAMIKNPKMLKKVIGISNKIKNTIGFYNSTIKNSSTNTWEDVTKFSKPCQLSLAQEKHNSVGAITKKCKKSLNTSTKSFW